MIYCQGLNIIFCIERYVKTQPMVDVQCATLLICSFNCADFYLAFFFVPQISEDENRTHKKSIASHHSIESLMPEGTAHKDIANEDQHHQYPHGASFHRETLSVDETALIKPAIEAPEDRIREEESPPKLSSLGVTKPGAFRVAWSEMNEVSACWASR